MQGRKLKFAILLFSFPLVIAGATMFGNEFISIKKIIHFFFTDKNLIDKQIFFNIRLPRVIMGAITGISLSASGVVFQAMLRNPLADPFILGVSAGAALGATIAVVLSLPPFFITLFALIGSLSVVFIIFFLSKVKGVSLSSSGLILSGIALGYLISSAILLIFAFSKSNDMHRAMMWLMGDLSLSRFSLLLFYSMIVILIVFLLIFFFARDLDIISFGEDFYKSSGVTGFSFYTVFFLASFLAAFSVSVAGVIGFVGLIVPHLARKIFGARHFILILSSSLLGGILLVFSDALGRTIAAPLEIPVGIITGFLGGIFFLIYMWNKR